MGDGKESDSAQASGSREVYHGDLSIVSSYERIDGFARNNDVDVGG